MKKLKSKIILSFFCATLLNGYEIEDPSLGNIAVEAGIWNTRVDGNIQNPTALINFKDDLGFDESKNVTSFGLDLKNDYTWLPNIYVNYFTLNSLANGNIATPGQIINGNNNYVGSVTSSIEYSELNTIIYGYLQQSIFEFDVGVNFKKIDYTQTLKKNTGNILTEDSITIKGPESIIPLPYIGLKIDLYPINTVLKAETSMLALGDDEAQDYTYSINYRMMKNIYISYGYRYTSWKTKNKDAIINDKYDMNLKGNYLNAKILF
ncbi:MAG: hypothetical protein PHF17_02085 [Arcobacteraceae bacterium]|nr:hypothetical protein [Arcobacteraceae bacterium]